MVSVYEMQLESTLLKSARKLIIVLIVVQNTLISTQR